MGIELPGSDQTFLIPHTQLAAALNQVSLGFWEVNLAEGNFMACTDQCKRNFGWPADRPFAYEDMQQLIVAEDLPNMQAAVYRAITENEPYFSQYRVKHPDGSIHWIEAQGRVTYEEGLPRKISGTTVDITKIKDLEILRDELLSVAMHELKTPLSAVKGSLQLLERHVKKHGDEKINDIAARALGSADRITRLITDMAQPLKAHALQIMLDKQVIDLHRLIVEITENAEMLHSTTRITIHRTEPLMVSADRYRIGQVLTNLINNAIKYSTADPQVDIYMDELTEGVEVHISDQGIGIPPEDRYKIFQKFYRSAGGKSVDGLGIGLFLCAEIILRHGGSIRVADKEGPGTVICFKLPYRPSNSVSD